jgi:hypothetical protein
VKSLGVIEPETFRVLPIQCRKQDDVALVKHCTSGLAENVMDVTKQACPITPLSFASDADVWFCS